MLGVSQLFQSAPHVDLRGNHQSAIVGQHKRLFQSAHLDKVYKLSERSSPEALKVCGGGRIILLMRSSRLGTGEWSSRDPQYPAVHAMDSLNTSRLSGSNVNAGTDSQTRRAEDDAMR
jgi:hypothetical protein